MLLRQKKKKSLRNRRLKWKVKKKSSKLYLQEKLSPILMIQRPSLHLSISPPSSKNHKFKKIVNQILKNIRKVTIQKKMLTLMIMIIMKLLRIKKNKVIAKAAPEYGYRLQCMSSLLFSQLSLVFFVSNLRCANVKVSNLSLQSRRCSI